MQPSRLPRPARATLWLFDLDDTLHHASPVIFGRMNRSMTEYVMRHVGLDEPQANALRREYWQRYGATLLGLMRRHGTDPAHFLAETHQFPDMAQIIDYDRRVRLLLKHLPGRKVLVSNAPRHYVDAVLASMRVTGHLHGIETIESMRFVPKPARSSLARLLRRHGAGNRGASRRHRVVMVEDNLDNLKSAKRLGLTTVWISRAAHKPAFVDFRFRSVLQLARQRFGRAAA
ncbi:MAG: pyrimidine 5-nucleotidase [Betaproteobacteria bacterium]|nr:pyrimidine 5-nucleotidase [Betaproteobacteria bacterium]